MIVIDKCESECLAVCGHQAIAQTHGEEAGPDLKVQYDLRLALMQLFKLFTKLLCVRIVIALNLYSSRFATHDNMTCNENMKTQNLQPMECLMYSAFCIIPSLRGLT